MNRRSKATEAEQLVFYTEDGTRIVGRIRRNPRCKCVRATLEDDARLVITAPPDMRLADIAKTSDTILPWLNKVLKDCPLGNALVLPKYVEIPMAGKKYQIIKHHAVAGSENKKDCNCSFVVHSDEGTITIVEDRSTITLMGEVQSEIIWILALQAFIRHLAETSIKTFILRLAKRAGYGKFNLVIRNQKTRWGSCSKRAGIATISINWRALLLPVPLLEHLCFHELAHLHHMNHSPAFHAELLANSPNSHEYEKILTPAWRELPAWTHAQI